MEKHIICLDLDKTLLDDKRKISDLNKEVIATLQKQGHEIVIVTGRAHYRSNMFYDELNLKSLMVNRNASYIHAPSDENYQETIQWIDKQTVKSILSSDIMTYMVKLYVENLNNVYVFKGEKDFYLSYPICNVIDYENHNLEECTNLISINVLNEDKEKTLAILESYYPKIKLEIYPFRDTMTLINVYPGDSDKKNAFRYLSEYYQVPLERIIAMGDGGNDINYIKEAGIGVAMINGIDEVKQNAKIITKYTNDESGVGMFLKEYFKL